MEVHVGDTDELGALSDLPDEVEHQKYRQADISGDEDVHIPLACQEDLESIEDDDECDKEDTKVGSVWLEGGFVGECITVDVIVFQALVESEVGDQDHIPSDKTCDGGDVDEPLEYGGTVRRNIEVCEGSSESCDDHTPNWQTALGAVTEEARSLARAGKTVKCT